MRRTTILAVLGALILGAGCRVYVERRHPPVVQQPPPAAPPPAVEVVHTQPRVIYIDHWGVPESEYVVLRRDFRLTDDECSVVLFLARRSGVPWRRVALLRQRGHGWGELCFEIGLSPVVFFYELDRRVGVRGPYAHAYERYWLYRHDPRRLVLRDADCVALVQMRVAVERYGYRPVDYLRARERRSHRDVLRERETWRRDRVRRGLPPRPVQVPPRTRPTVVTTERDDRRDRAERERHERRDERTGGGRAIARPGTPPGHGGTPPGHGGIPPGQAKRAHAGSRPVATPPARRTTPPGHAKREADRGALAAGHVRTPPAQGRERRPLVEERKRPERPPAAPRVEERRERPRPTVRPERTRTAPGRPAVEPPAARRPAKVVSRPVQTHPERKAGGHVVPRGGPRKVVTPASTGKPGKAAPPVSKGKPEKTGKPRGKVR